MSDSARHQFLGNVAGALRGRPRHPAIADRAPARLVAVGADLCGLFVRNAEAAGMHVLRVSDNEAAAKVVEILGQHQVASAIVAETPIIRRLAVRQAVAGAGIRTLPPDCGEADLFAAGAGITDASYGVAETGSILLSAASGSPRQAGLVPPVHVAVLRESRLLGDLLDLMDVLAAVRLNELPRGMCLVTGPSKSADIELALVKGVHGPGHEYVLLLPPIEDRTMPEPSSECNADPPVTVPATQTA